MCIVLNLCDCILKQFRSLRIPFGLAAVKFCFEIRDAGNVREKRC